MQPPDAALLARDPALPGLRALLDDDALAGLLGGPGAQRRYLRYKLGTSAVLGLRTADGHAALVCAYAGDGAAKLAKTARRAPRGAVLAVDAERRLLAATAAADRDLPAAALVAAGAPVLPAGGRRPVGRPLSYKPQRRLVQRLEGGAVLRAYRPADLAPARAAYDGLARAEGVRLPRVLADDPRCGLLAVEHLPGRTLHDLLVAGDTGARDGLRAAGRALALLHAAPATGLPVVADEVAGVRAAAGQVAGLLPALAGQVEELAADVLARLRGCRRARVTAVHGDFSADQVVLGPAGPGLIDLDRAGAGDPARDLGTAAAALRTAHLLGPAVPGQAGELLAALHEGYAAVRPLPDPERVAAQTAAALLRRAAEPFRSCRPDWASGVAAVLALAGAGSRR